MKRDLLDEDKAHPGRFVALPLVLDLDEIEVRLELTGGPAVVAVEGEPDLSGPSNDGIPDEAILPPIGATVTKTKTRDFQLLIN